MFPICLHGRIQQKVLKINLLAAGFVNLLRLGEFAFRVWPVGLGAGERRESGRRPRRLVQPLQSMKNPFVEKGSVAFRDFWRIGAVSYGDDGEPPAIGHS